MQTLFEKIKNILEPWNVLVGVIGLLLAIIGLFFQSYIELSLTLEQKLLIIFGTIVPFLIPLIVHCIKRAVEIYKQGKKFPILEVTNKDLNQHNTELITIINSLKGRNRNMWEIAVKCINEFYNDFVFEVIECYRAGDDVYIIITPKGNENNYYDFEVNLIDFTDGYLFGRFYNGVIKGDGLHLKNDGEVDPLLLGELKTKNSLKLSPRTFAVCAPKRSDNEK